MASRRMFSKRLINSAKFLKMPISSQALYFHLGLHADDDGIVEAYPILNSVGCSEDDLRVLVAKNLAQNIVKDCHGFSLKDALKLEESLKKLGSDTVFVSRIRAEKRRPSLFGNKYTFVGVDYKVMKDGQFSTKRVYGDVLKNKKTFGVPELLDVLKKVVSTVENAA